MNKEQTEHDIAMMLIISEFDWSIDKADKWMSTPNPNLGEATPKHLILTGRGHKVLQFIRTAIEENHRDE